MLTRSVGVINLSQFLQPPPRYSILIRYYSIIYHDSESGSRQMRAKETINTFAGIRKNCAMVACRPDTDPAKEPRLLPAAGATNVYYHNRRAVSVHLKHVN